jgi:hypothetical protein
MRVRVVETDHSLRKAGRLLSKKEQGALAAHLAENPMVHDVIPGLGGLRKARWAQASRGKGKRGGVRVIYFVALSAEIVFLLDLYSKGEKEDLSNADKKELRSALEEIKSRIH